MKNEILTVITEEDIKNKIYVIRGKEVMLDSDLAKLYECANGTKTINQSVKRHINRFPERYMFQLTEEEYNNLKSQLSNINNHGGVRKIPFAFTEQGVAMLSSVLRTEVAEEMSIKIMDSFVKMRHDIILIIINLFLPNRVLLLEDKVDNNTKKIN